MFAIKVRYSIFKIGKDLRKIRFVNGNDNIRIFGNISISNRSDHPDFGIFWKKNNDKKWNIYFKSAAVPV